MRSIKVIIFCFTFIMTKFEFLLINNTNINFSEIVMNLLEIINYLFNLDRVFCGESTNNDVFDEIVKPIIDRGVQGFNGTVFAYGQTASGKTYTMSGDQSNLGIIPLAIYYMFNVMNSSTNREYLLRYSIDVVIIMLY